MFNLCNPETVDQLDIKQFANKFTKRHLSFTNKKRIAINEECMKQFVNHEMEKARKLKKKQPAILKLKKLDYDKNSQDVELLAGMPVIARVNNKLYGISNNETFKIISVDSTRIRVRSDITDETKEIGLSEFQTLFYLAFCITVHKSQGCTFDHPYTIHEWDLFDWRLKYVALSRATKKEYINILF
jgi:ATP-dependent exoDNAse (exonuclease V) alpha subunit